ncbi:MAG: translation elongation factor Ts [Verrucomicrobia bacterium]|nr:translation elongation factor Ts [Verrucomicrobiota bacterium]
MADITAEMVKNLREATNVSMMDCKRALVEAAGDMDTAMRLLRERGLAVAAKKASRTANQGLILSATAPDGRMSAIVEVNCETDFVARNQIFINFAQALANRALATDGMLADCVTAEVSAKVAEIGENIVVRRNARFTLVSAGMLQTYIHLGGKVGVLLEINCTKAETVSNPIFAEVSRDVVLHVAAANPRYLLSDEIPAAELQAEREIYAKQVEGKPAQIVDKIVDGKIKKYYSEMCLVDQPFVKEPKLSIRALLAEKGKAIGDTLTIRRFVRYQLGV